MLLILFPGCYCFLKVMLPMLIDHVVRGAAVPLVAITWYWSSFLVVTELILSGYVPAPLLHVSGCCSLMVLVWLCQTHTRSTRFLLYRGSFTPNPWAADINRIPPRTPSSSRLMYAGINVNLYIFYFYYSCKLPTTAKKYRKIQWPSWDISSLADTVFHGIAN